MICNTCPHRIPCMSSDWNEHGHPNPPTDAKAPLTSVHTCRTCMEPVLSTYTDPSPAERLVVPTGCPRWRADHGSAMDCDACREERDRLHELDPRWRAGMVASREMMDALIGSVKFRAAHGENVVDLATEQEKQQKIATLSHVLNPLNPLLEAFETGEGRESYQKASELLRELLAVVEDDQTYAHEREICAGSFNTALDPAEWLLGLTLSIERHPVDPEALTHEWVLLFTDRPVASRTWTRWPIARRRMIIRMWEHLVRAHLAGSNSPDPA